MEIISMEDFLEYHSDRIEDEKCVLFLGPCFGLTDGGEKVHEVIRRNLLEYYKSKNGEINIEQRLDGHFDNLFILRNLKEGRKHEMYELRARLSDFYQAIAPHPVYDQIACLPFRAIVTCTPDLLLRNALIRNRIDHDFFLFFAEGAGARSTQKPCTYGLQSVWKCRG